VDLLNNLLPQKVDVPPAETSYYA